MRLIDARNREVNTGDIVWRGRKSYIFLAVRGTRVEVVTTDDRKMFMNFKPNELNLTLEV